ncbi:PREDICTED: Cysteine/Histidine-rich C1 domain [Prunus dulcis]|uniref:PREDICTED: Cysteine/Histidine-rich C1 domain n=1 Tax=Prunus dulcis TaxID=3755 RepID=A0A5E4F9U6_PRUDU|nr:PREDICTED: Cysteine/Histidine-rich C1 domain [Prunus dulcis]
MRAKSQCLALDTVATRVDPNSTFNLHKSCAEELSCEIEHPIHSHKLKFECKTGPSTELFTCNACHQPCRLAYACSPCDLALDLKCASNWHHILDRKKPHVHQFSVLRKGIPFDCEVCGKSQDSLPYLCTICHLLVGKECTQSLVLPHSIKITSHQHRLWLIWFLEEDYKNDQICKICYTSTNRSRAVYECDRSHCDYVAHTPCSRDKITRTFDDDR